MKLGKEVKLNLLPNYKTKVGTVNNKESKSIQDTSSFTAATKTYGLDPINIL